MNIEKIKNKTFAHRGIHNNLNIPENSTRAFQKAVERNIPIELDIHILKDNTLVVFHDDNLKRMTKIDACIKNYTYKELKKIRLLNTNYTIPTLQEILKLVDGKVLLNIELKNDGKINDICHILSKELDNYKGDFIIQSFYPKIIRWFKINKPNYIRGLLITKNEKNKLLNYLSTTKILFKYCSPNFLSVSKKIVKNKKIQTYRKQIPILTWTIKSDKEIEKYKNDTDGFIRNIK